MLRSLDGRIDRHAGRRHAMDASTGAISRSSQRTLRSQSGPDRREREADRDDPAQRCPGCLLGGGRGDEGCVAACGYGGGNVARLTENTTGNVKRRRDDARPCSEPAGEPEFRVRTHTRLSRLHGCRRRRRIGVADARLGACDPTACIRRACRTSRSSTSPSCHDRSPSAEGRCGSRSRNSPSSSGSTLTRRPSRWSSPWGAARTAWPSAAATSPAAGLESHGTVSRVDARTGRVLATIPVEGQPEDLVVGADGVWVTTSTS